MKNKSFSTFILTILLIVCTSLGSVSNGLSNMPNIIAESAIVMDMDTGEVIASKNAKVQRPVASTIKLLTSLIFAENISRGDMISFTEESLKTTQTALNNLKRINVGDRISSDDLMKAVMIYSANDSAYLMSNAVSGNYKNFVNLMNEKVKSLGLEDTHVVNPCGLESNAVDPYNKEINISTAYDIAVIAKEAYKNSWIRETISNENSNVTINIEGENVPLKIRNKILGQYGNVGGKTGNEVQAGHCFEGFFQREIFKKAGDEIATIKLQYRKYGVFGPKKYITVPVIALEDITYYKNDINDGHEKIEYNNENKSAWKLSGKNIELNFTLPDYSSKVKGKVSLNKFKLLKIYMSSSMFIIKVLVVLLVIAYFIRLRNLKRKRARKNTRKIKKEDKLYEK